MEKNTDKEKEEIKEIFGISKEGKEETIKTQAPEKIKETKEGQIEQENKTLLGFFLVLGILMAIFITMWFVINSNKPETIIFEHRNTTYEYEKTGKIDFYRTSFPLTTGDSYNIWIRNDPRQLEKNVPFKGNYTIKRKIFIKPDEQIEKCENSVIAAANFVNLKIFDTDTKISKTATCQPEHLLIELKTANATSIIQTNETCYKFNINNCEILQVLERYMTETFSFVNQLD